MRLLILTPTLGRSMHYEVMRQSVELAAKTGIPILHIVVGPSEASKLSKQHSTNSIPDLERRFIEEAPGTRGLYEALNFAMEELEGDPWTHFTYINDDDAFGAGFSEALERHFRESPEAFGFGRVRLIDEKDQPLSWIPTEANCHRFEALLAQGISPLNQQGMIVPRAVWKRFGGFRTKYRLSADLDFWLRAYRGGTSFRYHPLEVGKFRIRSGQLSGDIDHLKSEMAAVASDHAPRQFSDREKLIARWQFRLRNASVYFERIGARRPVRGMEIMGGG